MAVTAQQIKELRDRTGIGMNKCKEALVETNGDIELAITNLRKAGMASAAKKEARETKEGKIAFVQNGETIALAEAKAETDFVVNNERFSDFLEAMAKEVLATKPNNVDGFMSQNFSQDPNLTIDQYRATFVQSIGENIQVKRVQWLSRKPNTSYGIYSHMNGKILTLVELEGSESEEELARDVAMHCAAAAPEFLSPESVPADVVAHEKEIALSQVQNKPENIREKIITGKLESFYDANCLIRQKFIKDDSQTVQQLIEKRAKETSKPLRINQFIRWVVGE